MTPLFALRAHPQNIAVMRRQTMPRVRFAAWALIGLLAVVPVAAAAPAPEGQMTWGVHISLVLI